MMHDAYAGVKESESGTEARAGSAMQTPPVETPTKAVAARPRDVIDTLPKTSPLWCSHTISKSSAAAPETKKTSERRRALLSRPMPDVTVDVTMKTNASAAFWPDGDSSAGLPPQWTRH